MDATEGPALLLRWGGIDFVESVLPAVAMVGRQVHFELGSLAATTTTTMHYVYSSRKGSAV